MRCFECAADGQATEAIGLCHHCSVALCARHGHVVERAITGSVPINKIVELPAKARELLCGVCRAALEQPHLARSA